jgi:NADPH:quinone reductase-like Zn-dependent oxidoreductase
MNANVMTAFGGPEVLEYQTFPTPQPGPGQVLIKIHACSVNPVDWRIRKGELKMFVRDRPPILLGADISGEIAGLGPGATRLKVGDLVWARLPGDVGGYAEYIALQEDIVSLRPKGLSAIEAAAVPAGATTALQALRDITQLKSGHRVLINGASGGVGLFAIQLAQAFGAKVTAVCGANGIELVKAFGVDDVLDYQVTDFMNTGRKWDVIFDVSATRHFGDVQEALEEHGQYVTTIRNTGDLVAPVLNPLRSKKGHYIIVKSSASDLDMVRALFDGGRLKVVIDKVFPLARAGEAQSYIETGKQKGKVVLDCTAGAGR